MKKIYNIFSFVLILNIHIYLKNVECNDIINYNGLNLRNGLPTNSSDITNGLNNRNDNFINSKIDVDENKYSPNNANNTTTFGTDDSVVSNTSPKIIYANDSTKKEIDNTKGLSVTDSGIPDGGAFGGGFSISENSPLQGNHNKCPHETFCNGIQNVPHCPRKEFTGKKGDWVATLVKQFSNENKGVLVPPRRRQLCLGNFTNTRRRIKDEKTFKEELFKAALGESRSLMNYFNEKKENALTAIKYGFSDIGDIIKGTDLIDTQVSKNINSTLDKILAENSVKQIFKNRVDWWEANKAELWNALMCGYKVNKGENECPKHDNIDRIPQYLRWFREWGTYICKEYQDELEVVIALCNIKKTPNPNDSELLEMSNKSICKEALNNYGLWINRRTSEWKDQYSKFEKDKNKYENIKNLTPENYLKEMCSECNCKNKDLNNIFKEFDNNPQLLKAVIEKKKNQDQLITNSLSPTTPVSHSSTGTQEVTRTGESEGVSRTTSVVRETSNDINPKQSVQPEVVKGLDALAQKENNNDNILGWEFGPVSVPGTNPYISSEEKNSLELINLTSWDKEDIIKQNEDVQEEKEEEQADEELKKEEIEEEQDLLQDEEEHGEFEEEDEQDDLKEEEEEEQDEEEDKSTKEREQEKKTEDEKKEETIDSSDDKNAHESLSIGFNNNKETKKDAESIVKDLFSLFKEKNTFEDLLKDLTGDLASLFQKQ